jgi:Protein of unknown function (DUF1266)
MGFFSKLLGALKSIRINDQAALQGTDLKHVLVSSMYAEQQNAYLNSYATGIKNDERKKILEDYWSILNREDALLKLDYLLDKYNHHQIDTLFKALASPNNYAEIIKSEIAEDEMEEAVNTFRNLRVVTNELIASKFIANIDEFNVIGESGWHSGRGAFIARLCFEMNYISELELKQYLLKFYTELKKKCKTWEEYTKSYVLGRGLWGGSNNDGMMAIANDLLTNDKSPLKHNAL